MKIEFNTTITYNKTLHYKKIKADSAAHAKRLARIAFLNANKGVDRAERLSMLVSKVEVDPMAALMAKRHLF